MQIEVQVECRLEVKGGLQDDCRLKAASRLKKEVDCSAHCRLQVECGWKCRLQYRFYVDFRMIAGVKCMWIEG
jgi:hypothetical protein